VHTWRAFRGGEARGREVVLHCRHKGFCRLAIEQRAHLVPVLALGETLQLRNLLDLPALQQYTYRRCARRCLPRRAPAAASRCMPALVRLRSASPPPSASLPPAGLASPCPT
jgi:hypothetical protein